MARSGRSGRSTLDAPGVQVDAAHVHRPQQRVQVVHQQVADVAPGCEVRTHDGVCDGASFWKNRLPWMPSGWRSIVNGRSRRCGSSGRRHPAVVVEQVALGDPVLREEHLVGVHRLDPRGARPSPPGRRTPAPAGGRRRCAPRTRRRQRSRGSTQTTEPRASRSRVGAVRPAAAAPPAAGRAPRPVIRCPPRPPIAARRSSRSPSTSAPSRPRAAGAGQCSRDHERPRARSFSFIQSRLRLPGR